ncbi:hypothetical protein RJ55_08120 [Drechmeria coniospora]|nr:hypothetical protein RJ55_08120 [Drechmeria coniospora]
MDGSSRIPSTLARSLSVVEPRHKTANLPIMSRRLPTMRLPTDPIPESDGRARTQASDSKMAPRELRTPGNVQRYHRPLRAESLLLLDSTPGSPVADISTGSNHDSTDEGPETGIIAIGMALGSPTHPPNQTIAAWPYHPVATPAAHVADPAEEVLPKEKHRKWTIFGRSKSKRERRNYDDAQEASSAASAPLTLLARSCSTTAGHGPLRENEGKPKMDASTLENLAHPGYKTIKRSNTAPMRDRRPPPVPRTQMPPQPPPKDAMARTPTSASAGRTRQRRTRLGEPLLHVDIPTCSMDRYSVMFGDLIHLKSPMLACNQATYDRVITASEGVADTRNTAVRMPSRNASVAPAAPAPRPSPIQTGARVTESKSPSSSRARSNTSPAVLPSPVQATFDAAQWSKEQAGTRHIAKSTRQSKDLHDKGKDNPIPADRSLLISKFHRPTSTQQNKASRASSVSTPPGSGTDNDHAHIRIVCPDIKEVSLSTWNTAHPPAAESIPHSLVSERGRALPRPAAGAGKSKASEQDSMNAGQDTIEVSIARKVSVSRQQRALLAPLKPHAHEKQKRRTNERKNGVARLIDLKQSPVS